jgi:hypothetical protein
MMRIDGNEIAVVDDMGDSGRAQQLAGELHRWLGLPHVDPP